MKSLIFSTDMIRAILNTKPDEWPAEPIDPDKPFKCMTRRLSNRMKIKAGDVLYVKETWNVVDIFSNNSVSIGYKAGGFLSITSTSNLKKFKKVYGENWKSPLSMPKEAARIFLEVKEVREERLQDITEKDALLEGVGSMDMFDLKRLPFSLIPDKKIRHCSYKASFYELWDSMHGKKPGCAWEDNPMVNVITFVRRSS